MKGIYKGFKYTLSQIFGRKCAPIFMKYIFASLVIIYIEENFVFVLVVVKEDREMEIGNPTDVKHVAHIGWEGPSGSAPTWVCANAIPKFGTFLYYIVYSIDEFELLRFGFLGQM